MGGGGRNQSVVTKSTNGINSALGMTHSLEARCPESSHWVSESGRESWGWEGDRVAGTQSRREASPRAVSKRASERVCSGSE